MNTILAATIIVIPISMALFFICDGLDRANRHLDRIASSLFLIKQHLDDIKRGKK